MATIRIRTKLEPDTLVLPELKLLIGKTVDIEVTEQPDALRTDRWATAAAAVQQLTDYDSGTAAEQRAFDQEHVNDPVK